MEKEGIVQAIINIPEPLISSGWTKYSLADRDR